MYIVSSAVLSVMVITTPYGGKLCEFNMSVSLKKNVPFKAWAFEKEQAFEIIIGRGNITS